MPAIRRFYWPRFAASTPPSYGGELTRASNKMGAKPGRYDTPPVRQLATNLFYELQFNAAHDTLSRHYRALTIRAYYALFTSFHCFSL